MRRRVLATASVISLVCGAAAMCLWGRSTRVCDGIGFLNRDGISYTVGTSPGGIAYFRYDHAPELHDPHDPEPLKAGWSFSSVPWGSTRGWVIDADHTANWTNRWTPPAHRTVGFGWESGPQNTVLPPDYSSPITYHSTRVVVPLWFIAVLMLVPSLTWLRRHRRDSYRLKHGLCVRCGYDLRGSSDRCPECGTAIPVDTGATAQARGHLTV